MSAITLGEGIDAKVDAKVDDEIDDILDSLLITWFGNRRWIRIVSVSDVIT